MAVPVLPIPPDAYERRYFDELNRVLRLFFSQNEIPLLFQTARLQVIDQNQNVIIDQYLDEASGDSEIEFVGANSGDLNVLFKVASGGSGQTKIKLENLPTSASGLDAGTIYNDSGTLKVA